MAPCVNTRGIPIAFIRAPSVIALWVIASAAELPRRSSTGRSAFLDTLPAKGPRADETSSLERRRRSVRTREWPGQAEDNSLNPTLERQAHVTSPYARDVRSSGMSRPRMISLLGARIIPSGLQVIPSRR